MEFKICGITKCNEYAKKNRKISIGQKPCPLNRKGLKNLVKIGWKLTC